MKKPPLPPGYVKENHAGTCNQVWDRFMGPMTEDRYKELMDNQELPLNWLELSQGWHFCWEWDGLLIGPGMGELQACQCLPEPLLTNLRDELPDGPDDENGCPPF